MDGVELVMAVEEQFGISLDDAEAERIRTPRMLIDLIMAKVAQSGRDVCRTQRGFYLARRFLVERFNVARAEIGFETPIRKIVASDGEKEFWETFRFFLQAKRWPELEFSEQMNQMLGVSSLGLAVAGTFLFWRMLGSNSIFLALCGAILFRWAAGKVLGGFRKYIPERVKTMRDLSLVAAGVIGEGRWLRCEVAHLVRKICGEVLAFKPEDYHEDADFVKELGLS